MYRIRKDKGNEPEGASIFGALNDQYRAHLTNRRRWALKAADALSFLVNVFPDALMTTGDEIVLGRRKLEGGDYDFCKINAIS